MKKVDNYQVLFTKVYQVHVYKKGSFIKKISISYYFSKLKKDIKKLRVENFDDFGSTIEYDLYTSEKEHYSISKDQLSERELYELKELIALNNSYDYKKEIKRHSKEKFDHTKKGFLFNCFFRHFKECMKEKKENYQILFFSEERGFNARSVIAFMLDLCYISLYPSILFMFLIECTSFTQGLSLFANITLAYLALAIVKLVFMPIVLTVKEVIQVMQNQKYYKPVDETKLKKVLVVRKAKKKQTQNFKELVFEEINIIRDNIAKLGGQKQQEYNRILLGYLRKYKLDIEKARHDQEKPITLINENYLDQQFFQTLLRLENELHFVLESDFSRQQELFDQKMFELEAQLKAQLNLNSEEQTRVLRR